MANIAPPTPVTIITGFLGSGKTTLILNLIPQLPSTYRVALLKNEFGDVAIDSQLASSRSISGVQELLNGCICCNLVGQLGDALETLRKDVHPDRIIIETSGSAFPATLAMEVNRLARETGQFILDGVVVVIDVENWKGYEDTSYTAKLQARYTDLIVLNKWEEAGEEKMDECLDRLGDLDVDVISVRSSRGMVSKDALLGLDRTLARDMTTLEVEKMHEHGSRHDGVHGHDHNSEVEVLSITLSSLPRRAGPNEGVIDMKRLEMFLGKAPKEEIYRIKAILKATWVPGVLIENGDTRPVTWILNWAFGRWTFTRLSQELAPFKPSSPPLQQQEKGENIEESSIRSTNGLRSKLEAPRKPTGPPPPLASGDGVFDGQDDIVLRMTIVLARDEASKWKRRIEEEAWIRLEVLDDDTHNDDDDHDDNVDRDGKGAKRGDDTCGDIIGNGDEQKGRGSGLRVARIS